MVDSVTEMPVAEIGRVVVIPGSFPPMPCGVGDSAYELAHAMAEKGVQIEVLADTGADSVEIGEGPIPIHADITDWGLFGIKTLVRTLERLEPDIVHIHYPSKAYGKGLSIPFLPHLIRARRRKFKIVVTLHEFRLSHPARRLAAYLLIDSADAVCMPCPLELNALIRKHISVQEKIHAAIPVGPVGPDADDYSKERRDEMRRVTRDKWKVKDSDVVLLHYGTPTKSKGLEVLFKALKLLKQEGETPFLMIVGDHRPDEIEFHRLLKGQPGGLGVGDQVRWLGRLTNDELIGAFVGADVGVFPFLDGFSFRRSSLVGVLMWDIPIVTTEPTDELEQIIGQEKVKFCAKNDPRALATALLTMIANRKVLERLRDAPNPLREHFRWDGIVSKYMQIYQLVKNMK